MRFELKRVEFIPKTLEPGVLYAAEQFGAAAHLCACGCGSKVRTPLSPVDWSIRITKAGPSLYPSVGNWQQPCRSHYWIHEGLVVWEGQWTEAQITAGRAREHSRAEAYFKQREGQMPKTIWQKFDTWIRTLFSG